MESDPFAERLRAADLDRYLATLYAPAEARPALFALHALDLELLDVVQTTSQPMIGLVRLAWWREALERLDSAPPPGQPLLGALAARVLPRGTSGAMLSEIEGGFAALLEEPFDVNAYRARGAVLFAAAAAVMDWNAEAARGAGEAWATAELMRFRPGVRLSPHPARLHEPLSPRKGKGGTPPSLNALAALARADIKRGTPGRRGAPGRQLRLLWSIISGR